MCVCVCVQLAKKYHPDRNKGDPEASKRFTKIGEAYEVGTCKEEHVWSCSICSPWLFVFTVCVLAWWMLSSCDQVLSNPDKRKAYDYSGFSEYSGTGHSGGASHFTSRQAEEIFRQFFGGADLGSIFGNGFPGGMHQVGVIVHYCSLHGPIVHQCYRCQR